MNSTTKADSIAPPGEAAWSARAAAAPGAGEAPAIDVRAPVSTRTQDGRWRVAAAIDGAEAFIAADSPLAANGDAWASAMLLSAANAGATLRLDGDLDRRLHGNFAGIQSIARDYWGLPGARIAARSLVDRAPASGSAMFFTCGVDSFHTLRRRRASIDRLIFVRGLNRNLADLGDARAYGPALAGIEAVAKELGLPVTLVETDLRRHPIFASVTWDINHISALAAVAHALAPALSRVFLATSEIPPPYGSQPHLDPLWSSGAVEIVSDGDAAVKLDKVRAIADWPLAHRHLRVCYFANDGTLNCGRCIKCVGTLLRFEIVGARDRLETFPRRPLAEAIDGIPWTKGHDTKRWTQLLGLVRDPSVRAAMQRLLARRPGVVDRLRTRAHWMRRSSVGRGLRRLAKRLLVPGTSPHG